MYEREGITVTHSELGNFVHMSSARHVALDFPPRRSNKRTQQAILHAQFHATPHNSLQFSTILHYTHIIPHSCSSTQHTRLLAIAPDRMRPIDLQSADDLRHLVEKLHAAARAKTQAQLLGDPADPLRRRRCTRPWKSARFSWRR